MWALESATEKGFVGAWGICGDLPTDLIDGHNIRHPREALAGIADRRLRDVADARTGKPGDERSPSRLVADAKADEGQRWPGRAAAEAMVV